MGRMIDGVWTNEWYTPDARGHFVRPETHFRGAVEAHPDAQHPVEAGRYHLYVAMACPWAHRTLIARAMMGLEAAISVSVVHPHMLENGWELRDAHGASSDSLLGKSFLWEVYREAKPDYTGRVTVPLLWDRERKSIVCNESREILRMLATVFAPVAAHPLELSPPALRAEIDAMIGANYGPINNGVYRAGFARSQEAYEEAVIELFARLDLLEAMLRGRDHLLGENLTEADICLYTTLVRFDAVYHGHFKCNLKRIQDYPELWRYLRALHAHPAFGGTTDLKAIKRHYYYSHDTINPSRVIPLGPDLDFS